MTNLLLVGPSQRIREEDKDFFDNFKQKDYISICLTGGIYYLHQIDFHPDYYFFVDPWTIREERFREEILADEDYVKKIKVLGYNIYENELEVFKKNKFSSSKFESIRYKTKYLNRVMDSFKEKHLVDSEYESIFNLKENYNFNEKCMMFGGERIVNIDKFFGCLLPVVFYKFKNIKTITTIGFGDFDHPRFWNESSGDYSHYQESIQPLLPPIKNYIRNNNINIEFQHENYFYKILKND